MESVGTKAELMKGRKISGYANALAPSIVFAFRPGMTASHVRAVVKRNSIPATASHSYTLALERKPISKATAIITSIEIALDTIDVSTCPHNTAERLIGMVLNRAIIPFCISVNMRKAV